VSMKLQIRMLQSTWKLGAYVAELESCRAAAAAAAAAVMDWRLECLWSLQRWK
jgi:hypothetical protein